MIRLSSALVSRNGITSKNLTVLYESAELVRRVRGGGQQHGACPRALPRFQRRSWADDSYAHGGKDGTPHPVDRATYDTSIHVLTDAVRKARVGNREKTDALRRLATFERH
jgi:hypothetical protein